MKFCLLLGKTAIETVIMIKVTNKGGATIKTSLTPKGLAYVTILTPPGLVYTKNTLHSQTPIQVNYSIML